MNTAKLVQMANQIGAFYASEPDHGIAVEGVASHLRRFWEPRMRRELLDWVETHQGEGLQPLVLEAIRVHRERLATRSMPGGAA